MKWLQYTALVQFAVFMLLAQYVPARAAGEAGTSADKDVKPAEITVEKEFNLGEIVVEGEAETVTQVSTVDTVSKKTIEETTSQNVADAITTVPGVTLTIGNRNERTFNIRGFNQRYIPVFLDGIPIYIPFDGYIDAGKLPTSGISKITVSKGISSVLYGFNTMGGVVNIVSRKPQKPFEYDFETGYSQDATRNYALNLGSRQGKFYFTLNTGYLDSAGYPLPHYYRPQLNENGGQRNNSYIDGQLSGSFKAGFIPAAGHEYALGVSHVSEEYGVPPEVNNPNARFWRYTDWKMTNYYYIGDSQLSDSLQLQTRLYRNYYYNVLDSYDNAFYVLQTQGYAFHSTYDDHSTGGSVVLRSSYIRNNTISFSFHGQNDVHKQQANYYAAWESYTQRIFAFGLEDDVKVSDRLSLVFGASYDRLSPRYANGAKVPDISASANPQAGVRLLVLKDTLLHASLGKKTRFPTLKELYSGLLDANIPNPNLKPEKALNYETGIEQPLSWHSLLRCSLFYADIKNLIVSEPYGPASNQNQFVNVGRAALRGMECSFSSGYIYNNDFELNYTYLDARDKSVDATSKHLAYMPAHILYVSDLFKFNERISLFGKLEYNSSRYYQNQMQNNRWETIDGFWTVDLKLIGTLTKQLSLEVGAKNLFDENYQLTAGFPREGRIFFTVLKGRL